MRKYGIRWPLLWFGSFITCIAVFAWTNHLFGSHGQRWGFVVCQGLLWSIPLTVAICLSHGRALDSANTDAVTARQASERNLNALSRVCQSPWLFVSTIGTAVSLSMITLGALFGELSWSSVAFWSAAVPAAVWIGVRVAHYAVKDSELIARQRCREESQVTAPISSPLAAGCAPPISHTAAPLESPIAPAEATGATGQILSARSPGI